LQSKDKINWNASFSLVSLAPRKSFITLLTLFSHQYINNKNIPFPSSSSSSSSSSSFCDGEFYEMSYLALYTASLASGGHKLCPAQSV